MEFINILDINEENKVYPNQTSLTVFFQTDDDRFFIYALCTKENYQEGELIELSKDTYTEVKASINADIELIEIDVQNKYAVEAIINFSELKSMQDNISVGTTLELF